MNVRLLASVSAVLLLSCGDSNGPKNDHVVEGVNLTELFAAPSADEKSTVSGDWAGRDDGVHAVTIDTSTLVTLDGTPATLRIVSHEVDGYTHYGAVVAPTVTAAGDGSKPIIIYCHGGDGGESVSSVLMAIDFALGSSQDDYVWVIPSFRSEPLTYAGKTYRSTGPPSPWDRDVDDALALLNVAIATTPQADSTRIGVVGFSRGACVGMLMGVRDPRIDLVIEFFGPTDFFGEFAQDVFEEALLGNPRDLPGLEYLDSAIIQPLKRGDLAIAEARSEILRRSPVYFVNRLPPTQAHHGTSDGTVPVSEARRLEEVFGEAGLPDDDYHVYFYAGGGHNPLSLTGSFERARGFLTRLTTVPGAFATTKPPFLD